MIEIFRLTIFITARDTLFLIISNEHLRLDIYTSQAVFLEVSSIIDNVIIGQGNIQNNFEELDLNNQTANSKISNVTFM